MGKDGKRYKKIGIDARRWEKMGKDGGCIEECCFHVVLQMCRVFCEFSAYGGLGLCQICGLDFVSKLADGVSVRTVIRDLNRVKPYHYRMFQAACRQMQEDYMKKLRLEMEGMTLKQQFDVLLKAIETQRAVHTVRKYLRHHQIITVDMTQLDRYGIPKISFTVGKHSTLAFPLKIRIHVKAEHEGKPFEVDVAGIELTQTRGNLLY
ncbi:MAG: hypothetical protein JSV15_06055 [Candidatus Bathyarchaeota archaeon]|nr:MAG: hypothetical protein JSV15_06055 [Candidatus Bathyarchaeota archaeon]